MCSAIAVLFRAATGTAAEAGAPVKSRLQRGAAVDLRYVVA
jgi:hypothetical protein